MLCSSSIVWSEIYYVLASSSQLYVISTNFQIHCFLALFGSSRNFFIFVLTTWESRLHENSTWLSIFHLSSNSVGHCGNSIQGHFLPRVSKKKKVNPWAVAFPLFFLTYFIFSTLLGYQGPQLLPPLFSSLLFFFNFLT